MKTQGNSCTATPSRDLISQAKNGLEDEQLAQIPNDNALEQRINKVRKKHRVPDLDKPSLAEMDVPAEYRLTPKGEQFLLYDSREDHAVSSQNASPSRNSPGRSNPTSRDPSPSPFSAATPNTIQERILIFASPSALKLLSDVGDWAMDGTYKSCPAVFRATKSGQVFVISVIIRHRSFPCIFALLTRQNRTTFEELFTVLRRKLPSAFSPSSVMCDYDLAAILAFRCIFPPTKINGLFFLLIF
jgi:hypothetical protein